MKKIFLVSCLSFGLTSAFAGTMGPINDPGFGGLNVGLGSGFTDVIFRAITNTVYSHPGLHDDVSSLHGNSTAVMFTGNIGYGRMLNQSTYLGLKGAIFYSPYDVVDESLNFDSSVTDGFYEHREISQTLYKPVYNIDAVLGYELFPHFLPFVEAGVSFANIDHDYDIYVASTGTLPVTSNLNLSGYKTGYNVGIGANYLVDANWYLFSELIYHDLGKRSASTVATFPNVILGTQARERTATVESVSMLAGISYLFPV